MRKPSSLNITLQYHNLIKFHINHIMNKHIKIINSRNSQLYFQLYFPQS